MKNNFADNNNVPAAHQYEINVTYVTEWDDGETVIESPCTVNLISHEILEIGERSILQSPYSEDELDDNVEILDEEYVRFQDGTCASVVEEETMFCVLDHDGLVPFYRKF